MGHFAYLINSDEASNKVTRTDVKNRAHISLEAPRHTYPLPWICCFRTSNLAPYTINAEEGGPVELQVPIASVKEAIRQLEESFPRYERLAKESNVAREYWMLAVEALKKLPYRYITLRVSEIISMNSPRNVEVFERGFSTPTDALSGSDDLFEYYADVPPYPAAMFTGSSTARRTQDAQSRMRMHNSCVLYCPEYVAPLGNYYDTEQFKTFKELAEKGVSGAMGEVGLYYLKGTGTPVNIDEGLRWCTKGAEAGSKSAQRLLASAYKSGAYGIPIDEQKAAHWKRALEAK